MTVTIEERIERVEKQNRRLKWAMTVICVVAAGAFVLGQAAPDAVPDVIRAKRFEVVNEKGWAVVTLRSWELGGWIDTRNQQGRPLFSVFANEVGGGMLAIFNDDRRPFVIL